MTEILDTCRIFRDIDKHPLPDRQCWIDIKLICGSELIRCRYRISVLSRQKEAFFYDNRIPKADITQWRLSK